MSRAGSFALPAARMALLAASLLSVAGCVDKGKGGEGEGVDKNPKPAATAPSNATDPALNWGGTTPHDTPPVANPLLAQAEAVMRKADPGFDRFDVNYTTGDLDRDGRDDVVIEYGVGDEDATRHVAKSIYLLLARDGGLQLQPEVTEAFSGCPVVREIVGGQLLADALEACIVPFPKTIGYYAFEWDDRRKRLRQVYEQDTEQRVVMRLQQLREALLAQRKDEVDRHLRAAPAPTAPADRAKPRAAPEQIFADAALRRGFSDTVGMLSHIEFQNDGKHARKATLATSGAGKSAERALYLDLEPSADDSMLESDGYTYVLDASVLVRWPDPGTRGGHQVRFNLIDGDLYLSEHGPFDMDEER
ncbi:hypothetical protein IEQ11_13200 [Lysobacter capsici]|uniref:hypothetical protein n=1 Tax=Lysobacter capsici TaxID=435897 RepID=UPI00177EA2A3|nr:hypothetical protein [Lysobacter capsici]UOF12728.1 hypothetical protein IEQ11_13200 [Lysobacter capsici]